MKNSLLYPVFAVELASCAFNVSLEADRNLFQRKICEAMSTDQAVDLWERGFHNQKIHGEKPEIFVFNDGEYVFAIVVGNQEFSSTSGFQTLAVNGIPLYTGEDLDFSTLKVAKGKFEIADFQGVNHAGEFPDDLSNCKYKWF